MNVARLPVPIARPRRLYWILGVLWAALWLPLAVCAQSIPLTDAVAVRGDTAQFPTTLPPATVQLPHRWDGDLRESRPLWYRLRFQLLRPPAEAHQLAAYFEHICSEFEVQINGQVLTTPFDRGEVRSRACHEPVLVPLPAALLRSGDNVLDVKLRGAALQRVALPDRAAMLAPVVIGRHDLLREDAEQARLFNQDLTIALTALAAACGLAAVAMAYISRLDYLAYFGAAALGWALWLTLVHLPMLPLPARWSEALLIGLMPPVASAAMLFLLRYCGVAVSWLETSLWLQCLVVPFSLALAMPDRLHAVAQPWPWILGLELLLITGWFLRRAWQWSRPDFWVVATPLLVFGVLLPVEALLAPSPVLLPGKHGLNLVIVMLLAGLSWRLYQRYRQELRSAAEACAALERRLQDTTSDMERNFGQMAEYRVEQVAAKERKRIAADLHDDLGAKLLTIVHTSDSERIATLAREALEEMRLSVRGLTGKAVQLGDAVGDWRSEAMMRLSQGGVELVWNVSDEVLLSERKLSARAYVQTTRILREAISNLLKHSRATLCEVKVLADLNDFELTIVDNGNGIPMELDGKLDRGHGMMTMKSRAKQLQGQCLVESGPGFGTTIRLTLPL